MLIESLEVGRLFSADATWNCTCRGAQSVVVFVEKRWGYILGVVRLLIVKLTASRGGRGRKTGLLYLPTKSEKRHAEELFAWRRLAEQICSCFKVHDRISSESDSLRCCCPGECWWVFVRPRAFTLTSFYPRHNQVYFSLTLPSFFLHLLDYKNKLREYWLPRITDKLLMIGSQFIHMFTTSLGRQKKYWKEVGSWKV